MTPPTPRRALAPQPAPEPDRDPSPERQGDPSAPVPNESGAAGDDGAAAELAELVDREGVDPGLEVGFVSQNKQPSPVAVYLAELDATASRADVERRLDNLATLIAGTPMRAADARWETLRYPHVVALRAALSESYAPATVNAHLAAVRGILRTCWRLELVGQADYARAVDVPNVSAEVLPAGRELQPGELRALFASCADEATPAAARDAALLAILYAGGLRRAEAAHLELGDYDAGDGSLAVRAGKGRKQRQVYLAAGGRAALDAWLEVRGNDPGALLCPVDKAGRIRIAAMTPRAIAKRLRVRAGRAGVEHFTPHDCRRSFVSHLLEAGADISSVQRLAGHASPVTTQRYDRRDEGAKRRAAELLHVPFESR